MENLTKELNPEQKKAVTHGNGPLLIVAGAGTGKTTVITKRIAWLINEGKASPEEILALTFTDKAAGEMEERVDKLLPYGYADLWISTFHSFAERILKQHAIDIGLPGDFKLLNTTEQWLLIRENLDKFNLDYYRPLGNPTKFIHAMIQHFSRAKDEVIGPEEYLEYAENIKLNKDSKDQGDEKSRLLEIANAYHIYQNLLLENSALDFGDLINYTLKLFQERPKILEHYRKQFKYILLDEFQDTNWAQYALIKLLAAPDNNLTVVGDDDQSIYKFRGASISNILQFKKDYPKAKKVVLNTNYRSFQDILDLSHKFIKQNNPNRLEAKEKIDKNLKSAIKGKAVIDHFHENNLNLEIKSVLEKIVAIKREDKNVAWSDFAILVRANDSALPFVQALKSNGIPHQFMALRGLYTKPIILDIINYFKLLDNYHESTAMYRVLNFPFIQIPAFDLSKMNYEAYRKAESLFEVSRRIETISGITPETVRKIKKLLSQIEKHTALAREKNVGEVYLNFLRDSGYLEYLNRSKVSPDEERENNENLKYIEKFYKKITDFENSYPDPKLKDFMSLLNLELESGESGALSFDIDAGPDMIRVMTIHAAKGLEFDYVFLPNLVDKRFPTIERKEPIQLPDDLIKEILPEGDIHLEEERRLMYVAMTRAKKGLFFTSAEDYGGARKKKLSRFLVELGYGENLEPQKAVKDNILEKRPLIKNNTQAKSEYYLPKKFSFTQLATFSACPLQYKFAHILHIPIFGKPVFSFGKTIHNTLQKFFEEYLAGAKGGQKNLFGAEKGAKKIPSKEKLMEIYEESWIDEWYKDKKSKKEYYEKGKKALRGFYKKVEKDCPEVIHLEEGFNIKIGNYTLRGRIDRVDRINSGVEIIDYKTGKSKEKLNADDKKQLLIYQIAAEEALGYKPEKLTYYYIEDNKELSFIGNDKELEETKEKIIENIEKIKESNFTPTPGNPMPCKFCDFKDICEHRAPGA